MKNTDSAFVPHEHITVNRSRNNAFSLEAAPSQERKSALMVTVYDAFVRIGPGGATREEAYVPLGIRTQTGHPICSELIRTGKLIRTGRRGLSRLGRPAEILVADVHAEAA
jgi:hypothetical protein